ncbi:unnamed protein product [Ceutorhynchus assimilis]|uniref:Uncharacterized protein n=1 Tax=Ceutorhynchus assimilis TaxID=467358 RepID=A0A9N9QJW8_9CUCU|nr:unnamed protein product [Ceutorhynchus assimilis]
MKKKSTIKSLPLLQKTKNNAVLIEMKLLQPFLLLLTLPIVLSERFCGPQKHYNQPKGKIETDNHAKTEIANCTWSIRTVKNSVIVLNFKEIQLGLFDDGYNDEKNCLNITNLNKTERYYTVCSIHRFSESFSFPTNELLLTLEVSSESHLKLSYTSYVVNCTKTELNCYNSRFSSRKITKVCPEGMLLCNHRCSNSKVLCGDVCYDIMKQRCNGVIDCLTGEDELGCDQETCPNQIACTDQTKCLKPQEICDEKPDCKNGFDELNCLRFSCKKDDPDCDIERITEEHSSGETKNYLTYVIVISLIVMMLIFVLLICKYMARIEQRTQDLNTLVNIPLPPFRGPGENSDTEDALYFDEDEDIWQSLTANLNRIKNKRKKFETQNITMVKPPEGKSVLDEFFKGVPPVLAEDMAALASIKISREMCRGLRKTKSEERPLTRKLFVDHKDDSEGCSEDDEPKPPKIKKLTRANAIKSDTDYVKGKGVRFNFPSTFV